MLLQLQVWAFMLLQEGADVGWDPRSLWGHMGPWRKPWLSSCSSCRLGLSVS